MDGARSCFFLMALLVFALNASGQSDSGFARRSGGAPLLVLTTGELLEYPFETRSDGYEVELPGGLQFIESSRVLCVTNSRIDAWRELRGTYQSLTPDTHVRLARWCIKYQLADAAERELLDALHLDPNRQDARQLLQQVTSRRLSSVLSNKERDAASEIPGAPGVAALPEARSLGGLSAENARSFVRRVQPLLSSRCAAAGCHGPGTQSEFRPAAAEGQAALLLSPAERRDRAELVQREQSGLTRWKWFGGTAVDWSGWRLHPGGVRITLVRPTAADVGAIRAGATAVAVHCSSLRQSWRLDGTWQAWSTPAAGSVGQRILLDLCSNTVDGPALTVPPLPPE